VTLSLLFSKLRLVRDVATLYRILLRFVLMIGAMELDEKVVDPSWA